MFFSKRKKIYEILQKISTQFLEIASIPLFSGLPNKEIESISKRVNSLDTLRCRLIDTCNIFDRINKKQFDKFTGVETKGSVISLDNTLKKLYPEQHDMINAINEKINIIFLMRDYFTHGKNRNIKKAFSFLSIDGETNSYKTIWKKAYDHLITIFQDILDLTDFDVEVIKQTQIDEDTREFLEIMFINHNKYKLDDNELKKYLSYLLNVSEVNDIELSKTFNVDIFTLRNTLLSLYPEIIEIHFCDLESTVITIKEEWKNVIRNYYNGDYDEK